MKQSQSLTGFLLAALMLTAACSKNPMAPVVPDTPVTPPATHYALSYEGYYYGPESADQTAWLVIRPAADGALEIKAWQLGVSTAPVSQVLVQLQFDPAFVSLTGIEAAPGWTVIDNKTVGGSLRLLLQADADMRGDATLARLAFEPTSVVGSSALVVLFDGTNDYSWARSADGRYSFISHWGGGMFTVVRR